MADVEVVIKIPEVLYWAIKQNVSTDSVYDAVKNGTLLPKGHGQLVDRDKFEYLKSIHDAKYGHISWSDAIKKIKHSAPTIIEADREEQE